MSKHIRSKLNLKPVCRLSPSLGSHYTGIVDQQVKWRLAGKFLSRKSPDGLQRCQIECYYLSFRTRILCQHPRQSSLSLAFVPACQQHIRAIVRQFLMMTLSSGAVATYVSGAQATSIAAGLGALATVGWTVYSNWNKRKVHETAVVTATAPTIKAAKAASIPEGK